MSPVFPSSILGETFTQRKTPKLNTGVQRALSGKTSRIAYQAYPLYEWELAYNVLRDDQQRTNLVLYSQDLSQWGGGNSGSGLAPLATPNFALAPDGTLTAARIILNSPLGGANESVLTGALLVPPPGSALTMSIWLRTNDGSTVTINAQVAYCASGTLTVTPQWQRFSLSGTTFYSGGAYGPSVGLFLGISSSGISTYADLAGWGCQVEFGAGPTGLVPTFGQAVVSADLRMLAGLFDQLLGQWSTFLYQDPDFNTASLQPLGTGNGAQTAFQATALYTAGGGSAFQGPAEGSQGAAAVSPAWAFTASGIGYAGAAELVQNLIGAPRVYVNRYGAPEQLSYGARGNYCLQSQDMTQAVWTKQGGGTGSAPTVTANFAAAPDGTTTASRVQFNKGAGTTSGDYSQIYESVSASTLSIATSAVCASSVWLRSNDGAMHKLVYNTGAAGQGYFPITVTPTWQRFCFTGQIASGGAMYVNPALVGSQGTDSSADLLMWGAQIEPSPYAMRYLPTTTSANTITAEVSVGATGIVTFLSGYGTPANGLALLWSGSFYYRCRFAEDAVDFAELMNQWWEQRKLSFEEVIL